MVQKTYGFTIVELLIVIVVIAVLAAVSYVGYVSISNRAYDASVQNDLRNIGQRLTLHRAENGVWPVGHTQLANLGLAVSKDAYGQHLTTGSGYNLVYCRTSDGSGDTALVGRSKSGKMYSYTQGSVREFNGRWTGSDSTCTDALGVSSWGGSDRDWLYDNGSWRNYL